MKNLLTVLGGVVLGVALTMIVIFMSAEGMMMQENVANGNNFDEVVSKFEESVKKHGWSIPKVHDLQKSMNKFGHSIESVKVFELCHPDHASKILKKDEVRFVSALMPCRVAIYTKTDGKVYISRMNSKLMASVMSDIIPEVMDDAYSQNEEILKAILAN